MILGSALIGLPVEALDGEMGSIADVLFDQTTWKLRWLVVKIAGWLVQTSVLIHPLSVMSVKPRSQTSGKGLIVVRLTRAALKASCDESIDEPVSEQPEMDLYACPGSDPLWGGTGYFGEYSGDAAQGALGRRPGQGDPSLRSVSAINGYGIYATDGASGDVKDVLIDEAAWSVQGVLVALAHQRPARIVVLAPDVITGIGWSDQQVRVNISRKQVFASASWGMESKTTIVVG